MGTIAAPRTSTHPWQARHVALPASLFFDYENSCLATWPGKVLGAGVGEEDITHFKHHRLLDAAFAIQHFNDSVQDGEHFLAIIDVPCVGLIRPVQTDGGAVDVRDINRPPRLRCHKLPAPDGLHSAPLNVDRRENQCADCADRPRAVSALRRACSRNFQACLHELDACEFCAEPVDIC